MLRVGLTAILCTCILGVTWLRCGEYESQECSGLNTPTCSKPIQGDTDIVAGFENLLADSARDESLVLA